MAKGARRVTPYRSYTLGPPQEGDHDPSLSSLRTAHPGVEGGRIGVRNRSHMLCFLCGKKIGFVRSLVDQQYCSSEHRKEARLASSQALREEEDVELWAVSRNKAKVQRGAPSAGQTASIFA